MTGCFGYMGALFLALLWMVVASVATADTEISYRGLHTANTPASGSLFSVPESYSYISENLQQHDVVLTLQHKGLGFMGGIYVDNWYQSNATETSSIINELYYDFPAGGVEWSIGKKVLSWGVGYGFRPLDVVQRESRLADRPRELEGVPMIATDVFTANASLTAVWFNRLSLNQYQVQTAENELAFNYYTMMSATDVYSVAYVNENRDYMLGCGFATVVGDHMEWHGSVAYLSRYERYVRDTGAPLLAESAPFSLQSYEGAAKVVTGGSWTWVNGVSMLMEAWYDGTAYSEDDWERLTETVDEQQDLLGSAPEHAVYKNISWASRVYQSGSVMQYNTLVRLSYDGEKLDPALEFLWTPQDNGLVYRLLLDMEYNRFLRFFFTYKQLDGDKNSAMAQAPVERTVILGFSLATVF